MSHVSEGFNQVIQADFAIIYHDNQELELMEIPDSGTRNVERLISGDRNAPMMEQLMETKWIY